VLGHYLKIAFRQFMGHKRHTLINLIAWPAAYYFMNKWLQDFAYRIEVEWWVFILSSVVALLVALATLGHHAIRAAMANPVDSLRYE